MDIERDEVLRENGMASQKRQQVSKDRKSSRGSTMGKSFLGTASR